MDLEMTLAPEYHAKWWKEVRGAQCVKIRNTWNQGPQKGAFWGSLRSQKKGAGKKGPKSADLPWGWTRRSKEEGRQSLLLFRIECPNDGVKALGQKEKPNADHRFWSIFPFTNSQAVCGTLFWPPVFGFSSMFSPSTARAVEEDKNKDKAAEEPPKELFPKPFFFLRFQELKTWGQGPFRTKALGGRVLVGRGAWAYWFLLRGWVLWYEALIPPDGSIQMWSKIPDIPKILLPKEGLKEEPLWSPAGFFSFWPMGKCGQKPWFLSPGASAFVRRGWASQDGLNGAWGGGLCQRL